MLLVSVYSNYRIDSVEDDRYHLGDVLMHICLLFSYK